MVFLMRKKNWFMPRLFGTMNGQDRPLCGREHKEVAAHAGSADPGSPSTDNMARPRNSEKPRRHQNLGVEAFQSPYLCLS